MSIKLTYSTNNFIGLAILLIIYLSMRTNDKKMKYDGKLYLLLIASTAILMVLNILMDGLQGESGYLVRETYIIITGLYFILNPIPYMAWSLYADFYIYKSARRLRRIAPVIAIPAIISILLCVFSFFNKSVFYIDENNIYNRGNLFWLNASMYYSYCLATYIQIIIKRKSLRKKDYYSILTFAFLPAIGGVLQIVDTSQSFIWLSISIAALIIYLNIQNSEISEDYLTGLFNRRQLDMYLNNFIRDLKEDEYIFMIMIDINDFKSINDIYGHIEGDEALKHTANILTESFRSEDFISRYAGDEFVIIARLENKDCKEKLVARLKRNFEKFNKLGLKPYDISVSLGYDIYEPERGMDSDDFIMQVDKLMYKDKRKNKDVKMLPL